MAQKRAGPGDTLETLQNVLASAARIATELADNPLLQRLLDVFARMPAEDRETVIGVLEREVDLRLLTKEARGGPLSGVNVSHPNPSARVYLRVTDGQPPPYVAPEEIVQAVLRAARVMHRGLQHRTEGAQPWELAIRDGLGRMDPAERETIRWLHRRLLELVDEAESGRH